MISYRVSETISFSEKSETIVTFGITAEDSGKEIVTISDVTENFDKIYELVANCNKLNLSPLHIKDVIEDLICELN